MKGTERRQMIRQARREARALTTDPQAVALPPQRGGLVKRARARIALRRQIIHALRAPLLPVVVGVVVGALVLAVAVGYVLGRLDQDRDS